MNLHAAVPQAASYLGFGQYVGSQTNGPAGAIPIDDLPNWKIVTAAVGSATPAGGAYFGFYDQGAQYKVTTGKTAWCIGFYMSTNATAGDYKASFGTATATFSNGTTSVPTGFASYGAGYTDHLSFYQTGSNQMQWVPIPLYFNSDKYPVYRTPSAEQIMVVLYCKEK